jgi:voltage-dependent potassium channel beta subunit
VEYRQLGRSGLQVSVLSVGSWLTVSNEVDEGELRDWLSAARDAGVNFFDSAESYGKGEAESQLGRAFAHLSWPRKSYVVSTKFYWGLTEEPNLSHTLNRKYLLQGIDASLERLGLDFVDLVFCHRPDPNTPIEETVWTMNDIVERKKATYWGTSEWPASSIRAAHEFAAREHLRPPVTEQPQYSLIARTRVEDEYRPLCQEYGLGLTTWSPLASGLLTGKYKSGVPEGSRATQPGLEWVREMVSDEQANRRVSALQTIANDLDASLSQLAIAWCASNPRVSSVITGSSSLAQLEENLGASTVIEKLDPAMRAKVTEAFDAA